MSTVNFSVPDHVKEAFNETFKGANKSAIIAELMMEAVERVRRREQGRLAFDRILARRRHAPAPSDSDISRARRTGRP